MEIGESMAGLAQAPLFPPDKLKRLILPLIVEQLLAMTVGIADTVMITTVGEAAVSGVSLVDGIANLIIQVMAALCTGGAVVVAQYLGRQDRRSARAAAKQLVYVTTFVAVLLMAVSLIGGSRILGFLFGHIDADVLENARVYFMISALSFPFLAVYNAVAALFRSMGNSRISMLASLLMNVVNIGGNAILIYGCDWGAAGAATASLVSRALAAAVVLICIRNPQNPVFLHRLWRFEWHPGMVKNILRIGVPNGLENSMFHIGKITVQSLIATFGTAAIAANAIVNSINGLMLVPGNAIGLAIITVVGQCLGAGEAEQAAGYAKRLIKLSYLFMLCLGPAAFFAAPPMMGLFNLSAEAAAMAGEIMRGLAVCAMVLWTMSFPFANILRAAGDAKFTMVVSVASMWVCRIGFSYVFAKQMGLGLQGVWLAMYVDWVVRAVCFILRFRSGKWKTKKVIE